MGRKLLFTMSVISAAAAGVVMGSYLSRDVEKEKVRSLEVAEMDAKNNGNGIDILHHRNKEIYGRIEGLEKALAGAVRVSDVQQEIINGLNKKYEALEKRLYEETSNKEGTKYSPQDGSPARQGPSREGREKILEGIVQGILTGPNHRNLTEFYASHPEQVIEWKKEVREFAPYMKGQRTQEAYNGLALELGRARREDEEALEGVRKAEMQRKLEGRQPTKEEAQSEELIRLRARLRRLEKYLEILKILPD